MHRSLLALCVGLPLLGTPAFAQPPSEGSTHAFVDPVFSGTVFCDTFEEVHAIATASEPVEVFRAFFSTPNAQNEPTCAALLTSATVLAVRPIGIMAQDNVRFNAWAVETKIGDFTGFALYLEARADIVA